MTFETGQEELTAICEYLGLGDDPDSHATYATEAHRCYRMPNPTKIATTHQETYCLVANHTTCPVYRGEVPPRPGTGPAAGNAGNTAGTSRGNGGGARPFGGGGSSPRPGKGSERPSGGGGAAGRPPRPDRPVLPRPRSGGISMPFLTVALFVLAVVVVLAAFVIQNALNNGDDSTGTTPSGTLGTQTAKTATPGAANKTPGAGTPAASGTAGANRTTTGGTPGTAAPGATGTPGTPGPGGKTYVVKSGDFCGTIAAANNVTTDQLIAANPGINADCSNLQIGQTLKIP